MATELGDGNLQGGCGGRLRPHLGLCCWFVCVSRLNMAITANSRNLNQNGEQPQACDATSWWLSSLPWCCRLCGASNPHAGCCASASLLSWVISRAIWSSCSSFGCWACAGEPPCEPQQQSRLCDVPVLAVLASLCPGSSALQLGCLPGRPALLLVSGCRPGSSSASKPGSSQIRPLLPSGFGPSQQP